MSKRTISMLLFVGGAVLLVLSLAADAFGIGARAGFGWKQLTGAVLGLAALAYGYWLGRGKPEQKK
ncbi:MAG: hypothetical protein MUO42_02345 [Anaerolineaceae bacterium]|nr:hypothetical protein [Anaerolineaceae bacterium]